MIRCQIIELCREQREELRDRFLSLYNGDPFNRETIWHHCCRQCPCDPADGPEAHSTKHHMSVTYTQAAHHSRPANANLKTWLALRAPPSFQSCVMLDRSSTSSSGRRNSGSPSNNSISSSSSTTSSSSSSSSSRSRSDQCFASDSVFADQDTAYTSVASFSETVHMRSFRSRHSVHKCGKPFSNYAVLTVR